MTYKEYVQRNFERDIDKDVLTDKQKRFFRLAYEEYLLPESEFTVKSIKKCTSQKGNLMYVLDLLGSKSVIEVRYYLLDYRVKDFFRYNHLELVNWTDEEILKSLKNAIYRIYGCKRWHNQWIANGLSVSHWIDIWKL